MNENENRTENKEVLNGEVLTAEEVAALEKEERKKRRLANLKPFKPYSELTEEEKQRQHELSVKGGQKTENYTTTIKL